ncbi:CAP domain-containing protein [Patescibacteria group bacterium]|nr:CAP domain-containing protein [Patescibacteria group bacterium]
MKKSPRNIPKKAFFITWLVTIGLFFSGIALFGTVDKMSTPLAILILTDVLIGILAFLLMVISIVLDLIKKRNRVSRSKIIWLIISAMVALVFLRGQWSNNSVSNLLPLPTPISTLSSLPTPIPTPSPEEIRQEIISLVNAERIRNGLNPLKENGLLDKSAELKANDMFERAYWSHNSPAGVETWVFFKKVGYLYTEAGENLAKNFYNTNSVFNSWMYSPTHKANILKSVYEETGVGVIYPTTDSYLFNRGSLVVVQHFGTQRRAYTGSSANQIPSRTGNIIKYHDWCNNKGISVYQNEIIVKKSSDGNTYGMTKDDWECYETALKNRQN